MTIRTSDLGGSDWADGDIGFAADFNDTFGAVTVHRKQFSDATERSTTSGSFEDSGTEFTLSVPVDSMVVGFFVECAVKDSGSGDNCSVNIKINGTNLGTKFLVVKNLDDQEQTQSVGISSTETDLFTSSATGTAYTDHSAAGFTPLKILDTSTTLTVRILSSGGSTGNVKDVTIDVLYTEVFKED